MTERIWESFSENDDFFVVRRDPSCSFEVVGRSFVESSEFSFPITVDL